MLGALMALSWAPLTGHNSDLLCSVGGVLPLSARKGRRCKTLRKQSLRGLHTLSSEGALRSFAPGTRTVGSGGLSPPLQWTGDEVE